MLHPLLCWQTSRSGTHKLPTELHLLLSLMILRHTLTHAQTITLSPVRTITVSLLFKASRGRCLLSPPPSPQVNKTLVWLGLGSNRVGAEGAWALAESLRVNGSLLWLGLGANELGDRGALHLAGLLQGRWTLARTLSVMRP